MNLLSEQKTRSTLYLAGPLDACTPSERRGWREQVKCLWGEKFTRDPALRDYSYKEADLTDVDCECIVKDDLREMQESDVVLANCWKRSYGTIMEICYGRQFGKVVVVVVPDQIVSPFIRTHADYITDNLYEALEWLDKNGPNSNHFICVDNNRTRDVEIK